MQNKYSIFSFWNFLLIFLGIFVVTLHVFFLPFYVWDSGVTVPWFMLNGYIPYKDFAWIRMPFDLFLLAGWYKIFGATGYAYQLFIYTLFIVLTALVFVISKILLPKLYFLPFLFFIVLLFPLFDNAEEGEILIGIFNILLFLTTFLYFRKRNLIYLFIAGLICGISFLTKQNSALVIGALLVVISLDFYFFREKIIIFLRKITLYFLGIIIPIFCVFLYFIANNGLGDFLYYTLFFLLGTYSKVQINPGDGLLIAFSYISLLVPFILFLKRTNLNFLVGIFLILQIVALFPSLLPSFLSYRALTAYPLISIVAGVVLAMFMEKGKKSVNPLGKVMIITSFVLFLFFNYTFMNSYTTTITSEGFRPSQYITNYGERELKIADLIKKNSTRDEKIINYGSAMMIYVMSDRLPANKYIYPFPYVLYPYNKTTKIFTDNPPKLVVYDESLPNDHPGLSDWPFIDFMKKNYHKIATFGNVVIYKYAFL